MDPTKTNILNERQNQNQQPQFPQIKLSNEEKVVLKECRDEAFWKRSLPFMAFSGFAFGAAVKFNLINGNMYFLKQFIIAGIAFTFGKASYLNVCKEKIRTNLPPTSNLYKLYFNQQQLQDELQNAKSQDVSTTAAGSYDELRMRNRVVQQQTFDTNPSNMSSYDELRMRNRGLIRQPESQKTDLSTFQVEQSSESISKEIPKVSEPNRNRKDVKYNKYGDIIED